MAGPARNDGETRRLRQPSPLPSSPLGEAWGFGSSSVPTRKLRWNSVSAVMIDPARRAHEAQPDKGKRVVNPKSRSMPRQSGNRTDASSVRLNEPSSGQPNPTTEAHTSELPSIM